MVADAGVPGTVLRIATRGVVRTEEPGGRVRLEVAAGEPWDALVARLRGRRPRRRRVPRGHPGLGRRDPDPERRRLRPGGGRDDPRGAGPRPPDRPRPDDAGRGLRLHLPLERVQAHAGPVGGPRGRVRPRALGALRAGPLRRARPRAGRRPRRPRPARRRPRRRAGAAAGQGHGRRPRRPGLGQRGLVLHEPGPRRRRLRRARAPGGRAPRRTASHRPPSAIPTGGSRPRPRGSSSARASTAARATPTGSRSPPSTRSRSRTAARARRPSSSRSRARSPGACATRSGWSWSRSRCSSGTSGRGCEGRARGVPLGRRPGRCACGRAARGK